VAPTSRLRAVRSPEPTPELALIRVDDLRRLVREELDQALGQAREQPAVLLDRVALAKALTVSTTTIDRLRTQGLPTVWIIEAPRFDLNAVIAWLREQQPRE
jgi:hypothetical protein